MVQKIPILQLGLGEGCGSARQRMMAHTWLGEIGSNGNNGSGHESESERRLTLNGMAQTTLERLRLAYGEYGSILQTRLRA